MTTEPSIGVRMTICWAFILPALLVEFFLCDQDLQTAQFGVVGFFEQCDFFFFLFALGGIGLLCQAQQLGFNFGANFGGAHIEAGLAVFAFRDAHLLAQRLELDGQLGTLFIDDPLRLRPPAECRRYKRSSWSWRSNSATISPFFTKDPGLEAFISTSERPPKPPPDPPRMRGATIAANDWAAMVPDTRSVGAKSPLTTRTVRTAAVAAGGAVAVS